MGAVGVCYGETVNSACEREGEWGEGEREGVKDDPWAFGLGGLER